MLAGHPASFGDPVKAAAGKGHTKKHAVHHRKHTAHHHTVKHHPAAAGHTHHITHHKAKVHAKAKHATHSKARGLALSPGDVACCAAEALAASLRLSGVRVSDEDVLALYWHTADDPEAGASIEATLEAAWRFGLGDVRPRFSPVAVLDRPARPDGLGLLEAAQGGALTLPLALLPAAAQVPADAGPELPPGPVRRRFPVPLGVVAAAHDSRLVLGLDLPEGPHTVLAAGGHWWSWGKSWCPCEFPDAVIEEAWAVSWS